MLGLDRAPECSVGKWRPIELVFGPQAAHERISQLASIGIDECGMRNRWHQDAPQALQVKSPGINSARRSSSRAIAASAKVAVRSGSTSVSGARPAVGRVQGAFPSRSREAAPGTKLRGRRTLLRVTGQFGERRRHVGNPASQRAPQTESTCLSPSSPPLPNLRSPTPPSAGSIAQQLAVILRRSLSSAAPGHGLSLRLLGELGIAWGTGDGVVPGAGFAGGAGAKRPRTVCAIDWERPASFSVNVRSFIQQVPKPLRAKAAHAAARPARSARILPLQQEVELLRSDRARRRTYRTSNGSSPCRIRPDRSPQARLEDESCAGAVSGGGASDEPCMRGLYGSGVGAVSRIAIRRVKALPRRRAGRIKAQAIDRAEAVEKAAQHAEEEAKARR